MKAQGTHECSSGSQPSISTRYCRADTNQAVWRVDRVTVDEQGGFGWRAQVTGGHIFWKSECDSYWADNVFIGEGANES